MFSVARVWLDNPQGPKWVFTFIWDSFLTINLKEVVSKTDYDTLCTIEKGKPHLIMKFTFHENGMKVNRSKFHDLFSFVTS